MFAVPYDVVLHRTKDHRYFGVFVCEDVPMGVYVATIEPNSPASHTNIQPGDRVVAINGQSVSSMNMNPQEMIIQIANRSDTITLSIQPSDILKFLGLSSTVNRSFEVVSSGFNGFDQDLEQFLQSILNQNIQIPSSNNNEYIFTSTDQSSTLNHHRRHRRLRKRTYHTSETQTTFSDDEKENLSSKSLSERRSVPNMGTSQVLLRNNTPKETPVINNAVIALPAPSAMPHSDHVERAPSPSIRRLPSDHVEQIPEPVRKNNPPRQIIVRRTPNFHGYGFHIQYNRHFYLIHHVEPHSPAEKSGLASNDVIIKINNQPTDGIQHKAFVQIMNNSSEVTLLVQNKDSYMAANPELQEKINRRPPSPPPVSTAKNTSSKSTSGFNRALQKLKSR